MKHLFTLIRQTVAVAIIALLAMCPASISAQGTVVASNTMSATTPDGVSINMPIVSSGQWTIAENGASAEIGTTGANNYGPCLASPSVGNWVGVMVEVEDDGEYVFSFRQKVDAGQFALGCSLGYGDGAGEEWNPGTTSWFSPVPKEADETGDRIESNPIKLTAGTWFFVLEVDRIFGTATNLHVADFSLTYMGALPDTYRVNYAVEGGDADVELLDYSTSGAEPVVVPSGSEWNKWSMYRLNVTPQDMSENVSIFVNGNNVDDMVAAEDGVPFVYYGYVVNTDVNIVIRVGSGIDEAGAVDAGVTYDTSAALLSGQCGRTEIYDLSGKLVRVLDLRGTADLSSLDHGVYVVKTVAGTIKIAR